MVKLWSAATVVTWEEGEGKKSSDTKSSFVPSERKDYLLNTIYKTINQVLTTWEVLSQVFHVHYAVQSMK